MITKEIKSILIKNFPGFKFSVRLKNFAGGCSCHISTNFILNISYLDPETITDTDRQEWAKNYKKIKSLVAKYHRPDVNQFLYINSH